MTARAQAIAGVELSNATRVLYPDLGLTKVDLAHYYEHVAQRMLPHVTGRPLVLLRCPGGVHRTCFFQKHAQRRAPAALSCVPVAEASGAVKPYFTVHSLSGLVALVQLGVLEIHTWGCRADDLERPDRLVFDLDPEPSVSWRDVVLAAMRIRDILRAHALPSWVKTTGGKGLHIVAPIERRLSWDDAKAFARSLALRLVAEQPERYTSTPAKRARAGKIFIDYLRNARGATLVAPYSPRARPGAPVSTPLTWEELSRLRRSDRYNVRNLPRRLREQHVDPWAGMEVSPLH